jgi:hypothetical protein
VPADCRCLGTPWAHRASKLECDEPLADGLALSSEIKDLISTGLSLVIVIPVRENILEVLRRSIRRVIGGGYEHRETLEGGTIRKALAKLKVERKQRLGPTIAIASILKAWQQGRQTSASLVAIAQYNSFGQSVVRFRNCASGYLCDLRSVNLVPYWDDEVTVSSTGTV